MSGYTRNESRCALQVELNIGNDFQDQRQIYLLGERIIGMLLIPLKICSFNLLPKVRVKASDELACAIDLPALFKHERENSSLESHIIQVDIQDDCIVIYIEHDHVDSFNTGLRFCKKV